MAVIDLKNCVLEIRGGTGGNKLVVAIGKGNLTWDEKRNIEYILNRGVLNTVRLGDEVPIDVKLDADYEAITGAGSLTPFSVEDAFKHRGTASTWTSTSSDPCEPYCVDLYFFNVPPCDVANAETVILPEFRYEDLNHDPKAGTISIAGKCNAVQATATRGAVST